MYLVFPILGAVVSIQGTQINITEGTSGEICIVLENVAGGLERNVSVTLTTTAGTAGSWATSLHEFTFSGIMFL